MFNQSLYILASFITLWRNSVSYFWTLCTLIWCQYCAFLNISVALGLNSVRFKAFESVLPMLTHFGEYSNISVQFGLILVDFRAVRSFWKFRCIYVYWDISKCFGNFFFTFLHALIIFFRIL